MLGESGESEKCMREVEKEREVWKGRREENEGGREKESE